MKPGPQSETFHAGSYGFQLPERVNGWLMGLGIALMCVAAVGAAIAIAVSGMQPK